MKCDKCYFENPDDAIYCINCGKKIPENKKIKKTSENTEKNHIPQSPRNKELKENKEYETILKDKLTKNDGNGYYLIELKNEPNKKQNIIIHEITRKPSEQNMILEHKSNDYYSVNYKGPDFNNETIQDTTTQKKKKLWLTILLSTLVIGAGHIYLNQYKKAFIYITIALIFSILSLKWFNFIYIYIFTGIFQIYDAAICCYKLNNQISK